MTDLDYLIANPLKQALNRPRVILGLILAVLGVALAVMGLGGLASGLTKTKIKVVRCPRCSTLNRADVEFFVNC